MSKEIETRITELKKFLYPNNKIKYNIDKTQVKKALYHLLRECLKERKYIVEIGSYIIDITPKNLSVKYESEHTNVEVSNKDVYYETVRDIETRFFCISQIKKDEFQIDNPIIRTTGMVTNINGRCEEHFVFELYSPVEDNINNYLRLTKNFEILELPNHDDYLATIKRTIKIDEPRTDIIDCLDKNRVIPVFFDASINKYKTQVDRREYTPNNYSLLLPRIEEIKSIVSYLYSSMVEFYTEYMNENS